MNQKPTPVRSRLRALSSSNGNRRIDGDEYRPCSDRNSKNPTCSSVHVNDKDDDEDDLDDDSSAALTTTTNKAADIMFPKWPKSMMESNGDYTIESRALEPLFNDDNNGLSSKKKKLLYQKQDALPQLPVPSLRHTLDRFLNTALPLAESKEEVEQLRKAVDVFPQEAEVLQERLLQRKKVMEELGTSWLSIWWNQVGYLKYRESVVINVSYFFLLADDDPTLSSSSSESSSSNNAGGVVSQSINIKKGAAALVATAQFRNLVCSGTYPGEELGRRHKIPLCSASYKYMFHACRVPRHEMDGYRIYDPSRYSHCVVARKGCFFKIDFLNPATQEVLPLEQLERLLQHCIHLADNNHVSDNDACNKLGLLTGNHRDEWTEARVQLLKMNDDETNKIEHDLEVLESSALVLCLDDERPVSRTECGELFWHGNKSSSNNRWFDKSLQIIVAENGKCGIMGEHSMFDGMPTIKFIEHINAMTYEKAKDVAPSSEWSDDVASFASDGAIQLFQGLSSLSGEDSAKVDHLVSEAEQYLHSHIDDHQLVAHDFTEYGSRLIKQMGHSPDAYVQQSMQLASYRLFGQQVATYEATQVRPYLHGRTETTRSVSVEGNAFIRSMGLKPGHDEQNTDSRKEKLALLKKAVDAHVDYVRSAAMGCGVDRHFFGLSMLVGKDEKNPALFADPVFARSKHWRMSTSTLSQPPGFGPVVPNGIGLAYTVHDNGIYFCATARQEHDHWAGKITRLLDEALIEMKLLHDFEKTPSSKL